MSRKAAVRAGLVAVGALIGAILSSLAQKDGRMDVAATQAPSPTSLDGPDETIDLLRAEYAPRIEQLTKENEMLRRRLWAAGASNPVPPLSPAEVRAMLAEGLARSDAERSQRTVDRLVAAGYPPDRIEWLRMRSEERQRQRRLAETEQRTKGLPVDPVKEMAYVFDKDIELRYEIGGAEYERYLRALGKPTSVQVAQVLPDSIADAAGIRAGDVILDYDGKRLFNQGELDGLSMGKNGGSATITVNRDGTILKLVVPGGGIGVRSSRPDSTVGSLTH
ncbi:MAG: PDZ domain-containing protein [Pseudomonadota bacterium]|nr:PDZ domain-containing protein [Pseudomonadota bacterium]